MIESFRIRALRRFWIKGDIAGIKPDWRKKVRLILSGLDVAQTPAEMDVPGFRFHPLKGDHAGRFAILVSRNWRITFSWTGENATDVDLEDYHGG